MAPRGHVGARARAPVAHDAVGTTSGLVGHHRSPRVPLLVQQHMRAARHGISARNVIAGDDGPVRRRPRVGGRHVRAVTAGVGGDGVGNLPDLGDVSRAVSPVGPVVRAARTTAGAASGGASEVGRAPGRAPARASPVVRKPDSRFRATDDVVARHQRRRRRGHGRDQDQKQARGKGHPPTSFRARQGPHDSHLQRATTTPLSSNPIWWMVPSCPTRTSRNCSHSRMTQGDVQAPRSRSSPS